MRRPIRFSDSPYRPRRLDVLLEPLVYVSNLVVASCLYPAWRTSRVEWEPDAAELIRLFKERSRPIMCFAWHAYELNSFCAFRDFPRDLVPLAIGHDGPQSRALQQSAAWYGFPVWVYRRRSPVQPKDTDNQSSYGKAADHRRLRRFGGPRWPGKVRLLGGRASCRGSSRPADLACPTCCRTSITKSALLPSGAVFPHQGVPWPSNRRGQRNARRLSRCATGPRRTGVVTTTCEFSRSSCFSMSERRPNMRVQRTRSAASPLRSPLTRHPLGGAGGA